MNTSENWRSTVPELTLVRMAAGILTLLVIVGTGGREAFSVPFETFVYAMAFSHYFMALLYSRKQIRAVQANRSAYPAVLGLLILGSSVYFGKFSLVVYFGIHHAFNESYLLNGVTKAWQRPEIRALRPAAAAAGFFSYLFLLRDHAELGSVPGAVFLAGAAASYAVFAFLFIKAFPFMSPKERIDNCAAELILPVLTAISLSVTVRFLYIVAYHFVFWALRPVPKMLRAGGPELPRYLGLTLALLAGSYLVSPLGVVRYPMQGSYFFEQFTMWSYLHITISFALSDLHPDWIVRLFRPRRPVVV